ncbi:iron complex transport system substrate-binding protein [Arthrobacter sp. V1I9]|uniref:ABC transporter substrate-binding protein n=1 Tax=Arthrobacter sp. V1I9 TaxID=3042275 RepID=UPI0027905668|nr:ABC transporter substrate-binding protein [Arthrobacter sp. V1I9]MDQ0868768.1 iron complex transport system substrate-binding protein [Arthrobacter sp. V1I9]
MAMKDSAVQVFKRRGFLAFMGALPLALASCAQESKTVVATASADAFPVTVDHEFGSTILDAPPQHVVVLGAAEADICTALGLGPGGMSKTAQTPWFTVALRAIDGPVPYFFNDRHGIPVEEIKTLKPDVILGLGSSLSRDTYIELSEFAPVVIPAKNQAVRDWRSNVRLIGRVLGREDAAKALIDTTQDAIKSAGQDYPGLPGSTVLYLSASSVPGADIRVFSDSSLPVKLLKEFGLANAPALDFVKAQGRPADTSESPASYWLPNERASVLSADVLIVSIGADDMAAFKAKGAVPSLPAFGKGQVYFVSGNEALSMELGSPLGIAWAGRNIVPEIAKAAYLSTTR